MSFNVKLRVYIAFSNRIKKHIGCVIVSPGNDVLISRQLTEMMLYRHIAIVMNDNQGLLSSFRGPIQKSSSVEYRLL